MEVDMFMPKPEKNIGLAIIEPKTQKIRETPFQQNKKLGF